MKSSTLSTISRRLSPAAAALALLCATACDRDGDKPGTTAPAGSTAASASPLTMSVVVNAPDAQNRRSASVKFEASSPLPDGQLAFELPADCRILAGAAVRPVRGLGGGAPVSQELQFECPAGTPGSLKATFKGTDAAGKSLEQVSEGPLS